MSYFGQAGVFLIGVTFYFYITIVLLRFLLQLVRADFYNPISQFAVKATNPVLLPLRRFIPGYGGVDLAAVVLMVALKLVELASVTALMGDERGLLELLVLAVAALINLTINLFIFTIIVQVILSWVNPGTYNPVTGIIFRLNEPLLNPAQRLLPPMSGLDLSPLLVLIALQLLKILLVAPLQGMAGSLLY